MAFYIYEKSSTYIIGKPDRNGVARPDHRQFYKTMSAAKAGLTRIAKAEGLLKTDPNHADYRYAICECDMFHKLVEKKVKKKKMPKVKIKKKKLMNLRMAKLRTINQKKRVRMVY